ATAIQLLTPYRIRATTPPGALPELVDVEAVNGTEVQTLPLAYEYTPNFPEIDLDHLGSSGLTLLGVKEDQLGAYVDFGDVTGDGIDDLIVSSVIPSQVKVGIVRGGPGLPETLPAFEPSDRVTVISAPQENSGMQTKISVVGDVNGDGIMD